MGRLEKGVPGGQADHMTVVQALFYRQIIPVKNRVAGANIAQAANARAGRLKSRDDIAKLPALMQQGGNIRAHFAQMRRLPCNRFFPG